MYEIGEDSATILDRFLSCITIAVPPALPTAMGCGVAYAVSRMRSKMIYFIQPNRVNIVGHISWLVFDKTGTITEEGLTAMGVEKVNESVNFDKMTNDMNNLGDS